LTLAHATHATDAVIKGVRKISYSKVYGRSSQSWIRSIRKITAGTFSTLFWDVARAFQVTRIKVKCCRDEHFFKAQSESKELLR